MRPAGEVRRALLQACAALVCPDAKTGATLREMAHQAQVGLDVAEMTVKNMRRAGLIDTVGARRVSYRNRPVAEYRPAVPALNNNTSNGGMGLAQALQLWTA